MNQTEKHDFTHESVCQKIVENANSIILQWNSNKTITFVNNFALTYFGYEKSYLLGNSISVLFVKRPELENELTLMISNLIHNPDKHINEVHENVRSNGEKVWITYTNKLLKTSQNSIEILSIGNDITRLKITEQKLSLIELNNANNRLRKLNKSKNEFLSIASHELRAPLAGIISITQTLLTKKFNLPETTRDRFLNLIVSESKRLSSLLNELLDLTKIESGVSEIHLEKEDLNTIIKETVNVISLPNGKHLKLLLPNKPIAILADRDHLKQVLVNLLDNAIRYSKENSEIVISVSDKREYMQVNISDTGYGISCDELKKIFDKFYRTQRARMNYKKGSGLGLTIAKNIIESHGGSLWGNSEINKGSTFSFTVLKSDSFE